MEVRCRFVIFGRRCLRHVGHPTKGLRHRIPLRISAAVAFAIVLRLPASAIVGPLPVIDPVAIVKIVAEIQNTTTLVQTAQTNLQALSGIRGLSNVQGRIATVTGLLQQARSACQGAVQGRTMPNVCRVEANTANAQAAQLGAEMAQIQGLQGAAQGVGGQLGAQQATAAGVIEVATQLQELRQQQNATAMQKQIDERAIDQKMHGASDVNPW